MNVFKLLSLYGSTFIHNNKTNLVLFILLTFLYFSIEVVGISFIVNRGFNKPNYIILVYSTLILISLCLFNYLKGIFENKIACQSRKHSRIKFLTAIIDRFRLSYQDIRVGDLLNRIMCSTLEFSFAISAFTRSILPRIIIMIISSVAIFFINKIIGVILGFGIIIMLMASLLNLSRISKFKTLIEDAYNRDFDIYANQFNNLLNSYINNQSENDKQKIKNRQELYSKLQTKSENTLNDNTTILKSILSLILLGTLAYIYITKNRISKDSMIFLGLLIVFYISAGLSYSADSSEFFGHIGVCQSSYDKFLDLLKNKKENSFNNLTRGNISISNLSFGYSGHNNILQNINLIIPDKKKIAIMGRSGSGKSTLAKLILKLGDYKGQIKINDIDIQKIDSTTLRKKVIYINQRTELLEDTVIQNIKYGLNIKDKEIISILTKYQLQEVFSGLNQGIYEKCLIDGKNLSLGMQKVIILVRGILHSGNSLINIFDEPLAGLDQKSRKKVINMILQECKYKTVLIITHDPEVIPYMDRTFNINQYDS